MRSLQRGNDFGSVDRKERAGRTCTLTPGLGLKFFSFSLRSSARFCEKLMHASGLPRSGSPRGPTQTCLSACRTIQKGEARLRTSPVIFLYAFKNRAGFSHQFPSEFEPASASPSVTLGFTVLFEDCELDESLWSSSSSPSCGKTNTCSPFLET